MTRIKICGITNLEDALLAAELGADTLGFVFAESPRRIKPTQARAIIRLLPPFIGRVGVFVNENPDVIGLIANYCNLSAIQLHGDEDQEYLSMLSVPVIKAFRVIDDSTLEQIRSYGLSHFLLDAHDGRSRGGTGKSFDWSIAQKATDYGSVILGGGLNCRNVREALSRVNPYAVDVSSGVERRPGMKDRQKLAEFINEVKIWDSQTN